MIRLLGDFSLYAALFFACLQSLLPVIGYYRNNPYLLAVARPAAIGQTIFVIAAYALLTLAFGLNDFSIAYVAANSHPLLPIMYRLTAVWGAHEGSILLWILLLNGWTMVYAAFDKKGNISTLTLSMLGIISLSFLCFLIFTSNPFLPATQLLSGNDLNPLLQDPGLIIHPPMLYIGYVGLSVAFAITMAALLTNQLNKHWARMTRQFATAAWCFLTFGIALGSWWAYRVLGWGGFWFWDPVENASLLPWLCGTGFIHIMLLVEKRGYPVLLAIVFAIISFALSLLGTFLVRSGVLVSAHTFASDPKRGIFLLLLLALLMTASIALFVLKLPSLSKQKINFSLFSRETALLINSGLFFLAMLTVLLGTLYPLITDAFHLGIISVGAPYFNMVMMPLTFITMAVMGLAPFCHWQTENKKQLWRTASKNLSLSVIIAAALLWAMTDSITIMTILTLTLSLFIVLSVIPFFNKSPGMSLAHLGFATLMIGIMLSSTLNQERDVRMNIGDTVSAGPYQFLFLGIQGMNGSNYRGIQAAFDVTKNGRHITNLYPEKRIYFVREMVMTKVAIHPGVFRDLYLALGQPMDNDQWTIRVYYKPFIRWIWAGGLLMMAGGLFSLSNRKKS